VGSEEIPVFSFSSCSDDDMKTQGFKGHVTAADGNSRLSDRQLDSFACFFPLNTSTVCLMKSSG
jgi:hypothetical protein